MKAMIFAAGEGRRMRPLTIATPKPLLRVAERSLLEHQLQRLKKAGIFEVVINVAYLSDQIIAALNAMDLKDMQIEVSVEERPLETGGGILRALPLLGTQPFLLVNSDVWTDFDFRRLVEMPIRPNIKAHLVLVKTPDYKENSDFVLTKRGCVRLIEGTEKVGYTFSGISIICPSLVNFHDRQSAAFPLRDALIPAIRSGFVSGEVYVGQWEDVGTPERLDKVRRLADSH